MTGTPENSEDIGLGRSAAGRLGREIMMRIACFERKNASPKQGELPEAERSR